jgi:hypothetical protein
LGEGPGEQDHVKTVRSRFELTYRNIDHRDMRNALQHFGRVGRRIETGNVGVPALAKR